MTPTPQQIEAAANKSAVDFVCAENANWSFPTNWQELYKLMNAFAAQLRPLPRWIPVEERLPEKHDEYPVSKSCLVFDGKKYSFAFYSYSHFKWEDSLSFDFVNVTHWQPLPTRPQQ